MDFIVSGGPIEEHPAFRELVAKRSRFAASLLIAMLLIYYGFVALVAFAPALMGTPVGGGITLGFPLGLFVIVAAIALTGLYVVRANGEFDRLTAEIVRDHR